MKKRLCLLFACILFSTMSACAPKINDSVDHTKDPSVSATPTPVYEPFVLYFPDAENMCLVKEIQEIERKENESKELLILKALQKGPKNDQLKSPIASDAEINNIKTLSGLCTVDFSEAFLTPSEDNTDTRNLNIQAIVHSLCQLDTVEQVKINTKNETVATEEIDLSKPLYPDSSLLPQTK